MTQVKDVVRMVGRVTTRIAVFGGNPEFNLEFFRRLQEVGNAVCEETGVEYGTPAALCITVETELGPKAQAAFKELDSWFNEAAPSHLRES